MAATSVAFNSGTVKDMTGVKKVLLGQQLRKTSMCTYFKQGKCKYGSDCDFAHDKAELQRAPDFRKTRLCEAFAAGSCSDQHCKFAHGVMELRRRGARTTASGACIWFAQGKCTHGAKCSFSHDVGGDVTPKSETSSNEGGIKKLELLPFVEEQAPPSPQRTKLTSQASSQRTKLSSRAAMFTPASHRPVKVAPSHILSSGAPDMQDQQSIVEEMASLTSKLQVLQLRMDTLKIGSASSTSTTESPRECSTSAGSSDAGNEFVSSKMGEPMRVGEVFVGM